MFEFSEFNTKRKADRCRRAGPKVWGLKSRHLPSVLKDSIFTFKLEAEIKMEKEGWREGCSWKVILSSQSSVRGDVRGCQRIVWLICGGADQSLVCLTLSLRLSSTSCILLSLIAPWHFTSFANWTTEEGRRVYLVCIAVDLVCIVVYLSVRLCGSKQLLLELIIFCVLLGITRESAHFRETWLPSSYSTVTKYNQHHCKSLRQLKACNYFLKCESLTL